MSESLDNMSNKDAKYCKLSPIFSSIVTKFNEPKLEMPQTRNERITQRNVDNESVEPNVDINSNSNIQADTSIEMPNRKILHGIAHTATSTLGLILLYFTLSIGLSFYQRKLLKQFHYPLFVVSCHLVCKIFLSCMIRIFYRMLTGKSRIHIDWRTSLRKMSPSGLASGIDIGFSNWGLELVTVSLYTMTKSTTIVFILIFALILKLEKKGCPLAMTVIMISTGLFMTTYKSTNFNALGFAFLIFASMCSGTRWSFAQLVMQKSKLGLQNPVDMIYFMQPWMLLSIVPFTIGFEGKSIYEGMSILNTLPTPDITYFSIQLFFGAMLAFALELSQFLLLSKTSSLTLSVAGIFKEICLLVLAIELNGDQLTPLNVLGLIMCSNGIFCHVIYKYYIMTSGDLNDNMKLDVDLSATLEQHAYLYKYRKDQNVPLLQADILNDGGLQNFYNQLRRCLDPYGSAGTWITEVLNTSQYTFEVSPVITLMEDELIQQFCKIFGFESGDGLFSPGGSLSNMYSLVLARYQSNPFVKSKGNNTTKPLIAFTSEESHYSITKSLHWLGIGTDNLIKIKTDEYGKVLTTDLEERIKISINEGKLPFYVNATAGTTMMGAFDDLNTIADVCRKYNLWMHVDACLGGSMILSRKHRHLLSGIERADSISWNPHKTFGAMFQCAMFLVMKKGLLQECNSASANYLFHHDRFYDVSYDTVDKGVQCGRKREVLLDNAMEMSKYLWNLIATKPQFRAIIDKPFQHTNICFWYIPEILRGMDETAEWWEKLNKVASIIKGRMVETGTLMVGYSPLPNNKNMNFFRMVFTCHQPTKEEDIDFLLNEIERLGSNIVI